MREREWLGCAPKPIRRKKTVQRRMLFRATNNLFLLLSLPLLLVSGILLPPTGRRWSASSRGGSAGNRVRASGCQSEAPAGPCIPALVSKNQPSSPALWKDNKATGTGNLTRAKTFQKFTQNKQGQQALVIKERKESKKSI